MVAAGSGNAASAFLRSLANQCVTMAPSRAMPNTPPTSRLALDVAEAIPARARGTAPITAAVIGVITNPMPTPSSVRFHHSWL